MDKGKYTGRRVNLSQLASSFFAPFIFSGTLRASLGCGAAALSLITGIFPEKIALKNKTGHYSDEFMSGFLRRRGYRVRPLTQCLVSSLKGGVRSDHVILLSQLFRKNEGTWGVLYNAIYWHNYSPYDVDSITFLNKPILSAYIISHEKWQDSNRVSPPAASHPRPKTKNALSWNQLGTATGITTKSVPRSRRIKTQGT